MGIKLYRYRTFKKNWKEEAFDGIVEPSSPLYFNDPYDNNGVIGYERELVEKRHAAQHSMAIGTVRI